MSYTFNRWYADANAACTDIAGVGIDDLPDGNSWDAWSDGVTPREYARAQLTEAGYPGEAPSATPRASHSDSLGMVYVPVPLDPFQFVCAPSRRAAAALLVSRHGITPAEAAQAAADA